MITDERICAVCQKRFIPKDQRSRKPNWGLCCSRHCGVVYGWRQRQFLVKQRFFSRIVVAESGCWEWTGPKFKRGYGQVGNANIGHRLAHRHMWTLIFGEIPEDKFVLHRCDNRACVRPEHLFLGTQTDNVQDCLSKNRFRQRGETHAKAQLSDADVVAIRTMHKHGIKRRIIRRVFDVSQSTLSNILLNKVRIDAVPIIDRR